MPELQTKSFDQMIADQAVVAQAAAPNRALDFSRGSIFRALAESYGALAMWLQGLVLRVLALTRAATSSGEDLDSWMADFTVSRTQATFARGAVTFSRFTPAFSALIPFGTQIKSQDGAWTYQVIPGVNAAEAGFDAVQSGYALAPGQASITVPVAATAAGVGGNAQPNTVTLISSAIPYVDVVTNETALTGGAEAESDESLRAHFVSFIASLPRAVRAAIDRVVRETQPGLSWSVLEAQRPDGTPAPAFFTLVVDDGTGSPPQDLLARVAIGVEDVRALGVGYAVVGPERTLAQVSMSVVTAPGSDHAAIVGTVSLAVQSYINGLPLGMGLSYTRLSQIAYAASPLVQNVTNILLNGGTADIVPTPRQAVRASIVGIS